MAIKNLSKAFVKGLMDQQVYPDFAQVEGEIYTAVRSHNLYFGADNGEKDFVTDDYGRIWELDTVGVVNSDMQLVALGVIASPLEGAPVSSGYSPKVLYTYHFATMTGSTLDSNGQPKSKSILDQLSASMKAYLEVNPND